MRKKALILLIITITIFLSSCSGSVYIGEPPATQEEKDANIAEYGVIAEMFYDIFEEPKDEEHVKNILEYNGFIIKEKYDEYGDVYDIYEKKVNFEDKQYILAIKLIYRTYEGGDENPSIEYKITYESDGNIFILSKEYYGNNYRLKFGVKEDEEDLIWIDLVTKSAIIFDGMGGVNNPLYQNYLNGDYDAQITEMETIMEEELQPLPEDYVAPSTNK